MTIIIFFYTKSLDTLKKKTYMEWNRSTSGSLSRHNAKLTLKNCNIEVKPSHIAAWRHEAENIKLMFTIITKIT